MDVRDWIEINLIDPSYCARVSIDWDLMFGAIVWNIWLDRNTEVFDSELGVRQSVLIYSLWLKQAGQGAAFVSHKGNKVADRLPKMVHHASLDVTVSEELSLECIGVLQRDGVM
ncbi:hypothetical protein V6N11_024496 [Hibiscus sabdariffa]|uniref:RNase H type-1 domain-containing protein n=1 Tax=Hibiscus sabdariffa TaxID=183260 RepID=A0ABR2QMA2_9ROSI